MYKLISDFLKATGKPIYYDGLKDDMEKWIGRKLREERKKHQYSQAFVADKIYTSNSTVSNIENNNSLRRLDLLMRMCTIYKIVIGDLINEAHLNCLINHYQQ